MNAHRTRDRRRRPPIHLYLLGAAAILVAYLAVSQLGTATSSAARTETETVTAENGVVQTTVSGTGNVEAGTDDEVNFATSGTLKHVYVHTGETVKKGQILATLDPTSAKLTLNEAELTLKSAELTLTDAEDGISSTSSTGSGSSASTGSGTTVEDAVRKTATTAAVTTTPATSTTPATNTAPTTTTTPATNMAAKVKTVTVTVTTATPTTATPTATTATTTAVSATTIDSDKLAVESDEQTVASDQLALTETTLRAPVNGTIETLEDISPGNSVSSGSSTNASSSSSSSNSSSSSAAATTSGSLGGSSTSSSSSSGFAEIVNTKSLTMTVSFSESDIGEIKVGQAATVTLDALSGVELGAKVTDISSTASDSDSVVSYPVTLTVDQTDSQVRPGMSASAAVIVDQASGVTVPNAAVSGTGSSGSVTLVKDGKDTTQQVIVGLRGSSRTEIASGLSSGDDLLVTETLPSLGTTTTSTTSSSSGSRGSFGSFGATSGGTSGGFGGTGGGGPGGPP